MGKNVRRQYKNPVLSELEEREKIKESVLRVFRQRYSSPGGSGAIVVGKSTEQSSSQPSVLDLTHESTSSMTDSEVSSNSDKKTQKKRRRKKRQRTQRKIKKTENADRLDVAKHLKVANELRRRNMGLFNKGKKSSTISREIHIPEAVRKKTQEDLKRILRHSDESDADRANELNITNSPLVLPKSRSGTVSATNNRKSDLGYKSASSNCTPASAKVHNPVTTGGLSVPSSEDIAQLMPQEPPMEDISQVLIRNLDKKQFFPGRNLFEETVEELRKIMKQNSFSTTPMSQKVHSKKTDSVKRSLLLDRYSPDKSKENSQNQSRPPRATKPISHKRPQNYKRSCDNQVNRSRLHHCENQHSQQTDMNYEMTSMSSSQETYMDAKQLLKCNSPSVNDRNPTLRNDYLTAVSQRVQRYHNAELIDGKTLLECNDQMIAEACHQMEQLTSKPQPMETDRCSDNALKLLEQNDENRSRRYKVHGDNIRQIQQDILSILPNDIDLAQSSQSSGYQGSQNSRHSREEKLSSRMIVDQWQSKPRGIPVNNVPQYQPHNKENVCESMDILDYIDEPRPSEGRTKNPVMTQLTADKDNIQMWFPSNVHVLVLPQKPTFESPSPEKLRPRFMH